MQFDYLRTTATRSALPLLPIVLDRVPESVRIALSQTGLPFVDAAPQPAGRFVLYHSGLTQEPKASRSQIALDLARLERPSAQITFKALENASAATHAWQLGGLRVSEEIARVDKRAVRRGLMAALRQFIEAEQGVWVCISPYPFPYRSAFNFRLDHDEFVTEDFDVTLDLLKHHTHASSHYICGSTHEAFLPALARLEGWDVGSHGYWHHTYRDARENLRNLTRGIEVLREAGIEPSGFVAPHGRYNVGLQCAMEAIGITHSSEFALAYDERPFWPCGSRVLQLPTHPICLGLFLDAAARQQISPLTAAQAAADYLARTARAKYASGEPMFFYCHPNGRIGQYPLVLSRLLSTVDSMAAVWQTTLTQFAQWWRQRQGVRLRVENSRDELLVSAERLPAQHRLGIEVWCGQKVALLPYDRAPIRIRPADLAFESRADESAHKSIRIDRPHGLKGELLRFLDWERVTPLEELPRNSVRQWTKRALRRWRS